MLAWRRRVRIDAALVERADGGRIVGERVKRIGLVGAGYISDLHLGAITALPGLSAVAMCDRSPGRAAAKAHRHGGLTTYTDLSEMLERESLDAVHVLTPAETHENVVEEVLRAGLDVFVEKPFCVDSTACERLTELADAGNLKLGVSHNMLFDRNYVRLRADLSAGRFGRLDHVDVVCIRPFAPLRSAPPGSWLFGSPGNALIELGPHSAGLLLDLTDDPDELAVVTGDTITTAGGKTFHRRWDAVGMSGTTGVRSCWGFGDGFPEFVVHVRGRSGSATVDLQNGSYTFATPGRQIPDIDGFFSSARSAGRVTLSSARTLTSFLRGRLGDDRAGGYFERSIRDAIAAFHDVEHAAELDPRISPTFGTRIVALLERIAAGDPHASATAGSSPPAGSPQRSARAPAPAPRAADVLVVGGMGFIGRATVKSLAESGSTVRVASRSAPAERSLFGHPGVEGVPADFTRPDDASRLLEGVPVAAHLAFGAGSTWPDVLKYDVEPTLRFAETAAAMGVRRFVFASTIAVYWAGRRAGTIDEATPADAGIMRVNPYARGKAVVETKLRELSKRTGMEVLIVRPGIVVGVGANPVHWGVGAWPHPTVCALWGDGQAPLPFVLVDDCGQAIASCLTSSSSLAPSYNLVGDVLLTGRQYLDAIERAGEVRISRVDNRPTRYFLENSAKWAAKRLSGNRSVPRPSWHDADGRTLRAHFDNSAAKRDLGWSPLADRERFEQILTDMAAQWFA